MKLYELLHMQFDENEARKMLILAIRCFVLILDGHKVKAFTLYVCVLAT